MLKHYEIGLNFVVTQKRKSINRLPLIGSSLSKFDEVPEIIPKHCQILLHPLQFCEQKS